MSLTADDRALLREVFRAARKKGWRRDHLGPCGRERGSRYWVDSYDTSIGLSADGVLSTPISEIDCINVAVAVDMLVAVDVLPTHLSSAYKAGHANGHEQAYYASKTQWGIRRAGRKTVRITSDANARSLLRDWIVPGEMVMREVGPWEVVATNADLLAKREAGAR